MTRIMYSNSESMRVCQRCENVREFPDHVICRECIMEIALKIKFSGITLDSLVCIKDRLTLSDLDYLALCEDMVKEIALF